MRALAYVAFTALAIAGCAADANSNSHQSACTTATESTDCRAGEHCYRGFCVAGGGEMDMGVTDTGHDPDTGVDGGPDTGRDASRDTSIDTNPDADNHCDGGGEACTTEMMGACHTGHRSCGTMRCVRDHDPIPETCNDVDDDCDGTTDEESDTRCYAPPPTIGCTRGADGTWTCVGACRTGTQSCQAGGLPGSCSDDVVPNTDGCTTAGMTAVDEDCDGMIDEDCSCTAGAMRTCFDGPMELANVGRCNRGNQMCDASGHWGACVGSGSPMPETCANTGADDDCDGTMDNVPGVGTACTVSGAMGVCADGTTQCVTGSMACVGPTPAATEACDHRDDDCDGSIDEGIDQQSDANNCGMCGHGCGAGNSCCNGVCVDESTDEMNCNTCGMTCPLTANTCCASSCADVQTDVNNCGMCGHSCSGGQTCCGGTCVDPLSDEADCMGCGVHCSGATPMCCGGCRAASAPECTGCPVDCTTPSPTQTCCGSAGAMACRDRMTDEANCGSCGHACTAGQVCCGGTCQTNDAAHCGGACRNCATAGLGAGAICCADTCVPTDARHCTTCGMSCGTGTTCCGNGCDDLTTDPAHCGSCTNACTGATPRCTNSHCCGATQTYCGGSCVDLQTDSSNCGSCGHGCALLYGCNGGSCHLLGG